MQDEYQGTKHGNFQMVVNAFTQALRELPTDYVARVKNFLSEYLGTSRHPVPFGGRIRDFEYLDTWLTDTQETPYLLLAAPAGRGKSALLLRWCQRLLSQRNLAIAYFPVSIRFRTNLAGVAFPSLVALLASLHGEKVPTDPNLHEDVWRGLFAEYMTRPLPNDRTLLLVLDGVDEAADWSAGPDLFPLDPPPGLRVVLSARYLANDQDADAWLKRLGWMRPGLARTLELYPLDRTGIANVLLQMGFPLDLLSARVNIVSELYRLSEGDPLLVRLYTDDLWERGEAAIRFQPEDLHVIRPGLAGYFERWWKDQRLLWSKDAPQREAAAQIVLNLLAGALGPLSKKDILSLVPDEADIQAGELEQHLAPLARFVTGDGVHQGYVFSHPRLANYFLEERLSSEERQEVERRFLTWGEQTLTALNEGRLAPEDASSYIVQYYGAHLERAQAPAPTLLALVSYGWLLAWEKLDRANAGFLGDVERAWRAAAREDTAATDAGDQAPYLGDEIRCLLSQVSVNSVTSNISPRLMLEAVKTGIWTPAQGLACIRLISDLGPRARELVGLAPYVQEPLRTDILQEALDTIAAIKDEYARFDTLVELATGFSEELLWQVLEVVPAIEDEADRAGVLSELAPALSPYTALIERALDLVEEMEEEEYRALALEGLAPCFSTDQHERVLQLVEGIEEERYRVPVLKALIPHLSASLLSQVLQEAQNMLDGLSRIRLLPELVTHLSGSLQMEVVQEVLELEQDIEDREYRIEVQVKLAPFLSEDRLRQALEEVRALWDESYQVRALSDLLQYIPEELLSNFLQVALAMKSEQYRMTVLIQLLPRLSKELLEQTLDSIQAIWDEGYRAELLAHIARYASEDLQPRLLEIAATIKDQGYRIWLLAELEAPLAGKLVGTYSDMLTVFKDIKNREEQLQILLAITPRLSKGALTKIFDFMLPEIFGFGWRIQSEESRAHILAKLGVRLPENWLPTALAMVQAMRQEIYQVQALIALAPRIGQTYLSEALDIVRAMKDREKRSQVLEALVTSLPDARKSQRVQEMLQVLQVIKDETERVQFVMGCPPYLTTTLSIERARKIIEAVRVMGDQENMARTLKALVPMIPEDLFEEVLKIVQTLRGEEAQASVLEALAPHIPERLFPRLLQMAQAIQYDRWRTRVLTTVLTYASEDIITGLLETEQGKGGSTRMLTALIPYVTESSFYRLWDAAQAIPDERGRVLTMGMLASRMPEDFFPQLWETLQAISSEEGQMWVLRALAAHRMETLFKQVWEAVQEIDDAGMRQRMQEILMPYVPEHYFSLVWEEVQEVPEARVRYQILETLAARVPEDFFLQFLVTAQEIPDEAVRSQVLEELAPHVPERFFLQFFVAVRGMSHERIRAKTLKGIIPHVPENHFLQVWRAVQNVQNKLTQAELIEALAPHVPRSYFPRFWKDVRTMLDVGVRTKVLKALLPFLVQERFTEVLEIVEELPYYEETLVELMEVLVLYLSGEQSVKVLESMLPSQLEKELIASLTQITWEKRQEIRALATLAPHLPDKRAQTLVPALLKATRELKVEEDQLWLLTKLASHVPEGLLKEMLETIWSLAKEQYRVQVLKTLLPPLSEAAWTEVLELVLARMHTTGNANCGLELLKAADSLAHRLPSAQFYSILHEVLRLLSQRERRDTLLDLVLLIPTIQVLGSGGAVAESCSAALEVGYWWP
ncbi:MAG: hypothetical protein JO011_13005 [Ktedonobacteraceae bacterium]|nr:hypothetical protein [Ktedonobacteraceae bacterium]